MLEESVQVYRVMALKMERMINGVRKRHNKLMIGNFAPDAPGGNNIEAVSGLGRHLLSLPC